MSADNQQERPKNLNPWYITRFVEGEGTFHVAIYRDKKMNRNVSKTTLLDFLESSETIRQNRQSGDKI